MRFDTLGQTVVDGYAGKIGFHDSETVFDLISFVGYCQYVFCWIHQVGSDGIVSVIFLKIYALLDKNRLNISYKLHILYSNIKVGRWWIMRIDTNTMVSITEAN